MGKMIDLGKRPSDNSLGTKASSPEKPSNEKYYPSVHLDGQHELPGKVGSVVHAKVKLKKTSHTIRKEKTGTTHSQSFDVMGIEAGHAAAGRDDIEGEDDTTDGGRPNVQSMIEGELNKSVKARDEAKPKKSTDHLKAHQFKKGAKK